MQQDGLGAENSALLSPRLLPLTVFTVAYLIASSLVAVWRGNVEFLLYIAVMLLLILAVVIVHRSVELSRALLWGMSIWGLAHMAGGLVLIPEGWPVDAGSHVLYSLWISPDRLKYDHIVHAYGFGMTTWLCWQALRASILTRGGSVSPTIGLLILSATAGMGFGALNEIVEFAATLLIPETNVGGYLNTGWDLVANLVGSTAAIVLIWLASRHSSAGQ
jgi:hypothetical protein